jgi:plastocyanin
MEATMRTPRPLIAALAGAAALLPAPVALADDQAVIASPDNFYIPERVAVKPGETVTFSNTGGEHNVVWNDGGVEPMPTDSIDASLWPPAGTVARTFDQPGRYRYYCTLHGDPSVDIGMNGYVYVNRDAVITAVTALSASASRTQATLRVRASRAGKAKATFFRKSGRKFLRSGASTFSARKGLTTKKVMRAFTKGTWRVDIVVTDADRVASNARRKTFTVR